MYTPFDRFMEGEELSYDDAYLNQEDGDVNEGFNSQYAFTAFEEGEEVEKELKQWDEQQGDSDSSGARPSKRAKASSRSKKSAASKQDSSPSSSQSEAPEGRNKKSEPVSHHSILWRCMISECKEAKLEPFKSNKVARLHVFTVHTPPDSLPVSCSACGGKYSNEATARAHAYKRFKSHNDPECNAVVVRRINAALITTMKGAILRDMYKSIERLNGGRPYVPAEEDEESKAQTDREMTELALNAISGILIDADYGKNSLSNRSRPPAYQLSANAAAAAAAAPAASFTQSTLPFFAPANTYDEFSVHEENWIAGIGGWDAIFAFSRSPTDLVYGYPTPLKLKAFLPKSPFDLSSPASREEVPIDLNIMLLPYSEKGTESGSFWSKVGERPGRGHNEGRDFLRAAARCSIATASGHCGSLACLLENLHKAPDLLDISQAMSSVPCASLSSFLSQGKGKITKGMINKTLDRYRKERGIEELGIPNTNYVMRRGYANVSASFLPWSHVKATSMGIGANELPDDVLPEFNFHPRFCQAGSIETALPWFVLIDILGMDARQHGGLYLLPESMQSWKAFRDTIDGYIRNCLPDSVKVPFLMSLEAGSMMQQWLLRISEKND